jgi:hypothetical protein
LFFAKRGDFDECQIDKSGRWLLIKENLDGQYGEDNRIVDLQTSTETIFLDQNGAAGHSDLGYGYLVAEDNFAQQPGAVRVWQFGREMASQGQGTLVYGLSSWASGLGHIAHGNARSDVAIHQQMVCSSNASRQNLSRVNEVVCYRLDGSMQALVVAPNLTDLDASGGGDDYNKLPKGNLDVTGEYFLWTANTGTNRLDAFLVRVPQQRLAGGAPPPPTTSPDPGPNFGPPLVSVPPSTPTPDPNPPAVAPGTGPNTPPGASTTPSHPAPSPDPAPSVAGQSVQWMSLVNLTATSGEVQKTGGCDGCPDASGVSSQQVGSGDGVVFSAPEARTLRLVGLSAGGVGTAPANVNFSLRLQNGVAEVRESGTYRAEVSFRAGDTFQIAVSGSTVQYLKNGASFYTSSGQASTGMRVHAVFYDLNAALAAITLQSLSGGG